MAEAVETTGKTVEAALEAALKKTRQDGKRGRIRSNRAAIAGLFGVYWH